MVDDTQQRADCDHGKVKRVFDRGKPQMKYLGNGVHDAVCRREHHFAFYAQKYAGRGDEHGQRKANEPRGQRERQNGNEPVVHVGQHAERERKRDFEQISKRDPARQNALHRHENQITDDGRRAERNAVNLRNGVHNRAECRHTDVVAHIQHNGRRD